MVFPVLISQLHSYLIFRSCLARIRISVREVEAMHLRDELQRGGKVETMYSEFLNALALQGHWIDRYSSEAKHWAA